MKSTPYRCLILPALLLGLLPPSPALALDEGGSPLFGGTTLEVHGEVFDWDLAASFEEDDTWRNDVYSNGSSSLTVTGMIGSPDLAAVSGNGIEGYLEYGSYGDNSQSYSESGSFWPNGYEFTQHDFSASYYPDLFSGQLLSSGSETYSGPNGSYSSWWDESGNSGWSESASGDSQSANSSSEFSLFGTTYSWISGSWSSNSNSDYGGAASWTDNFTSPDGGWLTVSSAEDYSSWISMTGISGWDPYAGSFSASYEGSFSGLNELAWEARTSASFAGNQLWVGGTLVNWVQGEIDASGTITDYYEESGGGTSLTISGNARDYALNGAAVAVSGSGSGTYDATAGFSDSNIQTSDPGTGEPDPGWTDNTPFFTGSTVLWVDGTEYPFDQGYQDDSGNRTDTYVNSSAGTVTLSGNTSDPFYADVNVSHFGGIDYGSYFGEDLFSLSTYAVSIYPPSEPDPDPDPMQDPAYGPEAFWVRGQFYARTSSESNFFQSAGGATLDLGDNGDGSLWLAGTDATGSFSGSYSNQLGLFMLYDDQNSAAIPAMPANTNGSLQLDSVTPPAELPPAVMVVDGRIWVFWGTDVDDTQPATTAAYYGSAAQASASPWLLKLRLDGSGTVTYTDYSTGGSASGSYSTTTHLFQTSAPDSGFPMPVYGVDPNDNDKLWGLPDAPEGLPATFLVGGEVWRYTDTNGDGAALYQGYYQGQQLAVGAADETGLRLVAVTDPVYGNTQGTLNDVRGSVRLRDGRVAYSGSFDGQQINPVLNENNLQTIAADLDITGNVLTFGALNQSAATAGVTLQFQDVLNLADGSFTASLFNILSRPQAQWLWAHAASSSLLTSLPVMKLDASHKLTLYDPDSTGPTPQAGVVLDPAANGVSTIRGVLRVRPGGDIDMGGFTAGGEP